MSVREVLLKLLEDLGREEIEKFNFHLRDHNALKPLPSIPKSQLEEATKPGLVEIIFQTYNQHATEVVKKILEKIPRNDLVEKLQDVISRGAEVGDQQDQQQHQPLHQQLHQQQHQEMHHPQHQQQHQPLRQQQHQPQHQQLHQEQHQQSASSSTGASGLDVLEQTKRSPSVEVSSEVKAATGAWSVCVPDGKSSPEKVSLSPPMVKASFYARNTNTSSKYDHITCKDLIQSGPPAVYQLIPKKLNIGKNIRKMTLGRKDPSRTNRTILLVGETGTGKSTLINALVNYDMGVEWDDNVWFEIVEREKMRRKSEEQEPDVIVYEIFGFEGKTLPYSLTIIDTPGYGDTRGTEHDEIISQRLFDLFDPEDGVHKINVVGLVLKASENRLNDRLRYIFDSVVSLFGNDLEENLVALITYSFGRAPTNVLEALKDSNIKCAKNERNRPVHFLFDKCPNTERTKDSKVIWDIMKAGMREFTDYLKEADSKKLKTTAQVLNARIQLTACVQKLQERIQETEEKQREIKEGLKRAEQEMKNNELMVEVYEEYTVRENISGGTWGLVLFYDGAVCCTICKETCHHPCTLAWSPHSCNIMQGGLCTVCKGKCSVFDHVKEQWKYVTKTRKVKKEDADRKRRFEKDKVKHERLQKDLNKTMEELQEYKDTLLEEAFQHVLRLEQIALNKDSLSTHVHLDFLIEKMKECRDCSEKDKFQNEVHKLEEMKSRVDEGTRAGLRYKLTASSK